MSFGGVYEQVLEHLGREWLRYRPEDIRLDEEKILLFRNINHQVACGEVRAANLRSWAPSFCAVYSSVMLRELEEIISDGNQP